MAEERKLPGGGQLANIINLDQSTRAINNATSRLVSNLKDFKNLDTNIGKLVNIADKSFVAQIELIDQASRSISAAEKAANDDTVKNIRAQGETLDERKKKLDELRAARTLAGGKLKEDEEAAFQLLESTEGISDIVLAQMEKDAEEAKKLLEERRKKLDEARIRAIEVETGRREIRRQVQARIFHGDAAAFNDAFDIQINRREGFLATFLKSHFASTIAEMENGTEYVERHVSGRRGSFAGRNYTEARTEGLGIGASMAAGGAGAVTDIAEKMRNPFAIKSGKELGLGEGGMINTALTTAFGPVAGLLLAAFNRFNEVGKKALQLFEGTAGRYGYGEGFNQGEARQFLGFQQTARNLSAEYAVNLEQVEEAFKGLQEYSGVRTFGQLKKLAEATLQISNATGLATTEVTRLGSAYQKNFGYGAQESVAKAGKQLLGLMNSINSGLSSNLVLTNTEMAGLVQNLIEGTQGADVTKTLLPFIDTAYNQIKGLGIQSKVVGELLRNQMLEIKKSGAGLPGSLSSFMLGAGGLFTNRLGGAEVGIASQVGRGKFAYEQGQEMARVTTGPGREFWSSPKLLLRNDLVDLAFKLKGGDLAGLLASQSDAALSGITQRVYELYQIPGAAEAIGVSLQEITEKFSTIARNNPLQFKMLGGDLDKLSALSEYAKAEATIKTGRVGGTGPIATEEQLKAANDTRKAMVAQMTPVDRTNQLLEQLVGYVDQIVVGLFTIFSSDKDDLQLRGGLTKEEYGQLSNLAQIQQRDVEQQKQYDLLRATQNEFRGRSAARVDPVNGKVTTTVEMDAPPYQASIVNQLIAGTSRAIGNGG